MSKQDPIADALTRIRNAQMVSHKSVTMPASKLLIEILRVAKEEGYIKNYATSALDASCEAKQGVVVDLKYFDGKPVIETIKRQSSPGRKQYCRVNNLPKEKEGLGIVIMTTSKGVMTSHAAQKLGIGGEPLVSIY
jgi:small subunit ribosomal protein S8